MFAAEFEEAEDDGGGRRRAPRAPVDFDAEIGPGGIGRALCKVVDLSRHGCQLQTYSSMKRGQAIWLTLPRAGRIAANVMWADEFTAGCQFHLPLSRDDFNFLTKGAG